VLWSMLSLQYVTEIFDSSAAHADKSHQAAPLMIFAYLGPIIRAKCPEGFVLTEWTRQRYGVVAALYLSFLSLITMFLYMVAELSALQQIMNALTGMNGLPMVIVECAVTTIYTCEDLWHYSGVNNSNSVKALGGFKISFITDNIQGAMVIALSGSRTILLRSYKTDLTIVIIATITVGVETKIDKSLIDSSGLTHSSLLGWQLLYILPVAVLTNDFFLSNFWIRTFASKTDKDLWIGVSIAAVVTLIILTLVGSTGLIATWSGAFDPNNPDQEGSIAFFYLLEQLPAWTVGIVLVMVVSLSTAAFDSFQSAMVSTASNDLFRNKLNIWWVRGAVVLVIFPVVVLALKAPSILQIYLISDLVSASTIPVLIIGLSDRLYWWRGFEVVVGGLGGILTVFIFGTIYFGNALDGAKLILLEQGLYGNDWSAFGAFVAAPIGGLLWGFGASAVRLTYQFIDAKVKGHRFDALDRPAYLDHRVEGAPEYAASDEIHSDTQEGLVTVDHKGTFF
jgi:Na+/proline symporter